MSFDLQKFAAGLGWSAAGVSDLEVDPDLHSHFETWIQKHKGPQMKYLERRMDERLNPKKYLSSAQSILCFGLYYFPGWAKGEIKVSNYAWSRDYHEVLKEKLEETVVKLQEELGEFEYRVCVDTSPVLEKYWAQRAGLGWQGKNTLLLNTRFGSYMFLGEIISSIPIEKFQASMQMNDHCGTCTRCIEACPTDALEPYLLHAEKCISYLNLEHKGDFKPDTPSLHSWVAGCDVCQEVCPWNQKLIPVELTDSQKEFQNLSVQDIDSNRWNSRVSESALSYVPKASWPRNLHQALKK